MRPIRSARHALRSIRPARRDLRGDLVAGLTGAISSVPDGMAAGVLAGVDPVQGLYSSFAGPIAGGLTSSTRLMIITTTSAASLAAGSAVAGLPQDQRPAAVTLLALMAGAALLAAGAAGLGRYTRFVSYSVMTGFLSGIAINIIASQIPDLTGAKARGPFALAKAFNILVHPGSIDMASLLTGLGALAILVLLSRTRLAALGTLAAIVIPTVVVVLAGASSVVRVSDEGPLPSGIPLPHLPDFHAFSFSLIIGALAVAAIVLVQGAGVAEVAPNPGGRPGPSQDIIAQGVGNIAAGLFRAMPVGGSLGQTALNKTAGARSRWAGICCGVWVVIILAIFSGLAGKVVMPALGAVLIFAAAGSLKPAEVASILHTGRIPQIALVATFLATLFLPVAAAVGTGIVLSLLLQLDKEAADLRVVELVPLEGGRLEERPAPASLKSGRVMVVDVYGSLRFAGSRTLQARLPDPDSASGPAVVLRLRGRTALGATFMKVIADYASRLAAVDGRLYLSGLDHSLAEQIHGMERLQGPVRVFEATPIIGESTQAAALAAGAWLVTHQQ